MTSVSLVCRVFSHSVRTFLLFDYCIFLLSYYFVDKTCLCVFFGWFYLSNIKAFSPFFLLYYLFLLSLCISDLFLYLVWFKIKAFCLLTVFSLAYDSFSVYLTQSLRPSMPVVATILASAGAQKVSVVLLIGCSGIGMCLRDSNGFIRE